MQPRVLLDGLAMPESPRWHDGRLWLSTPNESPSSTSQRSAISAQVVTRPM